MANIVFNVDEFRCEEPIIGDTHRFGNEWRFKWDSKWDIYVAMGINAKVRLFYKGDGNPEVEYLNQTLPGVAEPFILNDIPSYDGVDFRLLFEVDDGTTCTYTFLIPNSSVIIN